MIPNIPFITTEAHYCKYLVSGVHYNAVFPLLLSEREVVSLTSGLWERVK